ncbi:MAG: hypothetical protein M3462_04605 [Chloroflexota bacterium]|nr:hypothetical protein [Chloroflexota bacterium]
MLHEVAITPDVFEEWRTGDDPERGIELRELLNDLEENGFVADLDKGHFRTLLGRVLMSDDQDDLRTATRKAELIARLNRLDRLNRFVRHPRRSDGHPAETVEWLELAIASHGLVPFDWLIVGDDLKDSARQKAKPVASPREARSSERWPRGTPSTTVRLCESEVRRALGPVLRHASRLEIIDPYLSCENFRRFHFINVCAALMGDRGQARLYGEIHIHTSELATANLPLQNVLKLWASRLEQLRIRQRSRHVFKVFVWQAQVSEYLMHDRFLMTNQCGILSGNGFECWEEDTVRETTWAVVKPTVWTKRRGDFIPGIGPFRCLGETVVK